MAGAPQQGVNPDWYNAYNQQVAANDDSGGLEGVNPPAMKFKEGDNIFRLMPPAEAIPFALAAIKAGQAADWARGVPPVCNVKIYLPTFSSSPAGGISLFGNKAVVSPATIFPGETHPVYGADPAQEFLEKEGIRWLKLEDLKRNPVLHAMKEALNYKERTALQVVHLGVSQNGAYVPFPVGHAKVETYFVYHNDFTNAWKRPLFDEPSERGRHPFDPFWYGINFAIVRTGKDVNTEYSNLHGIYGPPYGDFSKPYGYPMVVDQSGQPYMPEIERLLMQVRPWKQIMRIATPEEIKADLERTVKAVRGKYAAVQVPAGAPSPAGGPSYAPPPPGGPPPMPAPSGGPPPTTPAMAGGPLASPPVPGYGPPPVGGPPAGPPVYGPAPVNQGPAYAPNPGPAYAPPPPAYPSVPGGGQYPAMASPPPAANPPTSMPAVPAHPPTQNLAGYPMPPQGPAQAAQQTQQNAPAYAPPVQNQQPPQQGYAPPVPQGYAAPPAPGYPPQQPPAPPPLPGGAR